jgi:ABC-type uncharacterized transport system auxiliary subunit
MRRPGTLLAGLALLVGCLLRSADPPRFFRPGSAALDAAAEDDPDPRASGGTPIRLRGVRSEPFLRERIVWRVSEVEFGLYEQRRWIDLPAHYVDRALAARLRSTPGVSLTDDPGAATLRVDVLAFDDVLAPARSASVILAVSLNDPAGGRLLERTFATRVRVGDDDPESVAKAMGQALDDAVAQVADAVRLSAQGRRARSPR